jgi:16S rRNA (guanine527-N7)-methyltransferase
VTVPIPDDPAADVSRETVARELFGAGYPAARAYAEILVSDGIARGLVGPREAGRIWERHLLNSVVLADLVAPGVRVVDLGSGAGLPGLPIALARPDLEIVLLEPLLRRTRFLDEVVDRLDLGERVSVHRGRAEEGRRRLTPADVVVSRAVAPMERLVPWSLGLLRPGGQMLAVKGDRAEEELAAVLDRLPSWGATDGSVQSIDSDLLAAPVRVVTVTKAGEPH